MSRYYTSCKCYHERFGWLIFGTSARFWGFWTLLNPPDEAEHHDFLGLMGSYVGFLIKYTHS
jgi:hypothetical protein